MYFKFDLPYGGTLELSFIGHNGGSIHKVRCALCVSLDQSSFRLLVCIEIRVISVLHIKRDNEIISV